MICTKSPCALLLNDINGEGFKMSLRDAALNVRENAYAPYSGFKVGAAIIGADGQVYGGLGARRKTPASFLTL